MEADLNQERQQAHALLDMLPAEKLNAVRALLEAMVEPLARSLAMASLEEEEITPETNFFKDLEIDSIKAIEITVAIEKRFKISVRDEDVPKITTVKQAVEMVNSLLAQSR